MAREKPGGGVDSTPPAEIGLTCNRKGGGSIPFQAKAAYIIDSF